MPTLFIGVNRKCVREIIKTLIISRCNRVIAIEMKSSLKFLKYHTDAILYSVQIKILYATQRFITFLI